MKKSLLILLFIFISIQAKTLDFYKEDITFRLNPHTFYVDGLYYFQNNGNVNIKRLTYFPVDSSNNTLDSIQVFNLTKMHPVELRKKKSNGFLFNIEVNANDSAIYQIKYQQKIGSDSIKYILESTLSWGRPLTSAVYKLIVDKSLRMENFTFKPDKVYDFEDSKVYLWKKEAFLPRDDLVFKFKIP